MSAQQRQYEARVTLVPSGKRFVVSIMAWDKQAAKAELHRRYGDCLVFLERVPKATGQADQGSETK